MYSESHSLTYFKFGSFFFIIPAENRNLYIFFSFLLRSSFSFDIIWFHLLQVDARKETHKKKRIRMEKKHFVFRHNFQNRLLFIFNRFQHTLLLLSSTSNRMFSTMFSFYISYAIYTSEYSAFAEIIKKNPFPLFLTFMLIL